MQRNKILGMIYDRARPSDEEFDFPTYGGLPKRIADALSSEFVDAVQDTWGNCRCQPRAEWVRTTLMRVNELGDKASDYAHL